MSDGRALSDNVCLFCSFHAHGSLVQLVGRVPSLPSPLCASHVDIPSHSRRRNLTQTCELRLSYSTPLASGVRRRKSGPHSAWRLEERERGSVLHACAIKANCQTTSRMRPDGKKPPGWDGTSLGRGKRVAPPALLSCLGGRVQLGAG